MQTIQALIVLATMTMTNGFKNSSDRLQSKNAAEGIFYCIYKHTIKIKQYN